MITSDDVLTVLKEEAEEDALRLAELEMRKLQMVLLRKQKKIHWLLLNLLQLSWQLGVLVYLVLLNKWLC